MPNRRIHDNIFIAHEAFHGLKHKVKGTVGAMAIKVDIQKAYDTADWSFLMLVMRKIGFSSKWIMLINSCVTIVNCSILIKGRVSQSFQPSRGLRQGDPLSPYLYLLVSNCLSRMFGQAATSSEFKGYKIARHCATLTHLLFCR